MTHKAGCVRSDGEWFCGGDCTHDRDEARREYNERITSENATLRRVLVEIAQGHPYPVGHAQSTLSSLSTEERPEPTTLTAIAARAEALLGQAMTGPLAGAFDSVLHAVLPIHDDEIGTTRKLRRMGAASGIETFRRVSRDLMSALSGLKHLEADERRAREARSGQ